MELLTQYIVQTFDKLPFEYSVLDSLGQVMHTSSESQQTVPTTLDTILSDKTLEVFPLKQSDILVGYIILHTILTPREKRIVEQYIQDLHKYINTERDSVLRESKRTFWKHILYGDLEKYEIVSFIEKFNIPTSHSYANVFLKVTPPIKLNDDILLHIENVFKQYTNEIAIVHVHLTGFGEAAVLFELSDTKRDMVPQLHEQLKIYSSNIIKQLNAHPQLKDHAIMIGVSESHYSIERLSAAFIPLKNFIRVAARLNSKSQIIFYDSNPMYILLNDISPKAAATFVQLVFKHIDQNDEHVRTSLQALFENDLNVSRAAKSVGIHRHTLEYRLHSIQKNTGVDPARFDNALQFRLALILRDLYHF